VTGEYDRRTLANAQHRNYTMALETDACSRWAAAATLRCGLLDDIGTFHPSAASINGNTEPLILPHPLEAQRLFRDAELLDDGKTLTPPSSSTARAVGFAY